MASDELIPAEIKRFILTSIDSVPHLEAALLLRHAPKGEWDAKMMAQRLFISEKKAGELLSDLCAAGFAAVKQDQTFFYYYHPISPELGEIMDQLADTYSKNLVEVTKLIHSRVHKQAQQFGDAFKWQNEKDS